METNAAKRSNSARGRSESGKSLLGTIGDAERVALMLVQEAKTSFGSAMRIVLKLVVLSSLGFVLASNCCLSRFLVPVGVVTLAIAAGWLDVIREECKCSRFFPGKKFNSLGVAVFHWQWIAAAAFLCFVLNSLVAMHEVRHNLWGLAKYAGVPLALMLVGRAIEPYRFQRARADIQKAERLVRQLVAVEKASDISALAPLVQFDQIPLYKLCSVGAALRSFARSVDTKQKLMVELDHIAKPTHSTLFSVVYTPFRRIASEVFLWEARDTVLYMVVALYLALVYVGSFYFPWAPLCILVPFMGPKSKTGRYLRDLQNDIRLAQGSAVEKKGGMIPEEEASQGWSPINWPMLVYIATCHLAAFYAALVVLLFNGNCPLFGNGVAMKWETCIWAFITYVFSGLGITAGVHRLWAHRTYKAGLPLKVVLMVFNSMANQGTIFHWARDHRVHHLYSDTVADPHDANRGFWFSHVGWLLFKKHPAVHAAGKKLNLSDLYADPVVMFQHNADPFWNLMWCFALPAFPALAWGDSLWNGFLLAAFRYMFLLHATWAVNSVVHYVGTKPYNAAHKTTENGWVSLFALGEGWHNWHHAFDYDYAAAEMGAMSQFNPTKVFIDGMALCGLAWDRKRAVPVWERRKARWEERSGRPVLESIEGPILFRRRVVTFGPALDGDEDAGCDDASTDKTILEQ